MVKVFLILVLIVSVFTSCRKPYGIEFEEEVHNFGTIESDNAIKHAFVFTNTGTRPLILESVRPACPCTEVHDWDTRVEPGKQGKIPVTFTMENYNGDISKVIFVTTNVPERKSVRLTLAGRVIIPVEIIPLNTWLGEVTGETEQLSSSFEIRNNLETGLEIISIIPPEIHVEYRLVTLEKNRKFRLEYTILPPFKGSGRVNQQFTLQTNNKDHEFVYPRFHYAIQNTTE